MKRANLNYIVNKAEVSVKTVFRLLKKRGLRIPDDIYNISRFLKSLLTVYKQPIYNIGKIAGEILIDKMTKLKKVFIKGSLIVRGLALRRRQVE